MKKIIVTILLLLCVSTVVSGYLWDSGFDLQPDKGALLDYTNIQTRGLQYYWPCLEGSGGVMYNYGSYRYKTGGNESDFVIRGTVNFPPKQSNNDGWMPTPHGTGMMCDGSVAAARCSYDTQGWSAWSMSFWVRPDSYFPTIDNLIFNDQNSATQIKVVRSDHPSVPEVFYFQLHDGVGGYPALNSGAGNTVPLNEWTHIVSTYDGVNAAIYFNGVLQNSGVTATTTIDSSGTYASFGSEFDDTNGWDGMIYDMRVYNRGLVSHEVKEIFFNGYDLFISERVGDYISSSGQVIMTIIN